MILLMVQKCPRASLLPRLGKWYLLLKKTGSLSCKPLACSKSQKSWSSCRSHSTSCMATSHCKTQEHWLKSCLGAPKAPLGWLASAAQSSLAKMSMRSRIASTPVVWCWWAEFWGSGTMSLLLAEWQRWQWPSPGLSCEPQCRTSVYTAGQKAPWDWCYNIILRAKFWWFDLLDVQEREPKSPLLEYYQKESWYQEVSIVFNNQSRSF